MRTEMQWEVVIGLETHVQLSTASKIFSGASTAFGAAPNTQACAIDLALPGVLPVLNKGAVERAIRFGLAVGDGSNIAKHSIFARKNYFYPDLPKGYQISQYEIPVVQGGTINCVVTPKQGQPYAKTVRLTRAHLEEDAGKSLHEDYHGMSGIDLNRAGTPLLEIVSEPDMRSSAEAVAYAKALHSLVVWLGICDGNMQEGSFRCDANVSVRPAGSDKLGTRREIKNLNSFKFLQQAIDYEVQWQIAEIEEGRKIRQATVLFDPDRGETREMRSKEDAMDYRYFPDPDLLPLAISREWIERIRTEMPELPGAMRERFKREYELPEYDASLLTSSLAMSQYFESTLNALAQQHDAAHANWSSDAANGKIVANWIVNEIAALLNRDSIEIEECPIPPRALAEVVCLVLAGTLPRKNAKELLQEAWGEARSAGRRWQRLSLEIEPARLTIAGRTIDLIIEARGLKQISDAGAIEKLIDEVLAANPGPVSEFRAGKEKAFNSLVGQAMKATKGKANPQQVNEILRRKLAS